MRKMSSLVFLRHFSTWPKKKSPQTTTLTHESQDGPFREASKDKMQSETYSGSQNMIKKITANCLSPPDGKMQDDKIPDWLSLIFHCNPFLWKRPKSTQVNAKDFTRTCKKEKEAIVHVHPTTKLCRPLSLWSQVSKPTSGDGKAVGRNTSKSQSSRFTPNQGSHCLTHKYTHYGQMVS